MATTTTVRENLVYGTVQESPLAAGATNLVMAGRMQNLPTVTGPMIARLVIDAEGEDDLAGSGPEIVWVTAYTHGAASATISRGKEGTTQKPHSAGISIACVLTTGDITELIAMVTTEEATRATAITTEQAARVAGDSQAVGGVLSGTLPNPGFAQDMATQAELDAAAAAATTLINNEATARANADTTLQNNINAEASARGSADTTLQNNINSEASTRGSADTTLQNNINAEASARAAEDATLLKTDGSRVPDASMIPSTTYWSEANPIGAISNIGAYATANFDAVVINKRRSDSALIVDFGASAYVDTAGPLLIGVSIDGGAAAQIGTYYFNETGAHRTFRAIGAFGALGVGAHTVQVQFWWVPTGYCQSDVNDTGTLLVHEALN